MKPVVMDSGAEDSEDEISVGCPSPQPDSITSTTSQRDSKSGPGGGVRSFSILDILNHRPAPTAPTNNPPTSSPTPPSTRRSSSPAAAPECPAAKIRRKSSSAGSPDIKPPIVVDPSIQLEPDSKSIIRPWDYQHLALPAHFHQVRHQIQHLILQLATIAGNSLMNPGGRIFESQPVLTVPPSGGSSSLRQPPPHEPVPAAASCPSPPSFPSGLPSSPSPDDGRHDGRRERQ